MSASKNHHQELSETLEKINRIRDYFSRRTDSLDAYLITAYDQHDDLYIDEADKRISYMTGYTGNGGCAMVTYNDSVLWVDKRNRVRAYEEVTFPFELMESDQKGFASAAEWMKNNFPEGAIIGACGKYVPVVHWLELSKKLKYYQIKLVDVEVDLVDKIWRNRPRLRTSKVIPYPITFSGEPSYKKMLNIRHEMRCKDIEVLVVTELDNIAWLLNLRGSDLRLDPLFYSFLVISLEHIDLFVSDLDRSAMAHLFQERVMVCEHNYNDFYEYLSEMAQNPAVKRISISTRANYAVYRAMPESKVIVEMSLVSLKKCVKNEVEASGIIEAHVYDGYALCKFFCWLNNELKRKRSVVTEMSAIEKLEQVKRDNSDFLGNSVPTVIAAGAHSGVMYYENTATSDVAISINDTITCKSGSHYTCGTTDAARTFNFGVMSELERECYTRVFKGHVSLTMTVFPEKTKGFTLDALARRYLWRRGLDYGHPTGRGIGAYLSAQEGPSSIDAGTTDDAGLRPNMFITTEPSYYEEDLFGVKLENVLHVVPANVNNRNDTFLTFENVTLCPYQTSLLNLSLMSPSEITFLNSYHLRVRNLLCPVFRAEQNVEALKWLIKMTEPLVP